MIRLRPFSLHSSVPYVLPGVHWVDVCNSNMHWLGAFIDLNCSLIAIIAFYASLNIDFLKDVAGGDAQFVVGEQWSDLRNRCRVFTPHPRHKAPDSRLTQKLYFCNHKNGR